MVHTYNAAWCSRWLWESALRGCIYRKDVCVHTEHDHASGQFIIPVFTQCQSSFTASNTQIYTGLGRNVQWWSQRLQLTLRLKWSRINEISIKSSLPSIIFFCYVIYSISSTNLITPYSDSCLCRPRPCLQRRKMKGYQQTIYGIKIRGAQIMKFYRFIESRYYTPQLKSNNRNYFGFYKSTTCICRVILPCSIHDTPRWLESTMRPTVYLKSAI